MNTPVQIKSWLKVISLVEFMNKRNQMTLMETLPLGRMNDFQSPHEPVSQNELSPQTK